MPAKKAPTKKRKVPPLPAPAKKGAGKTVTTRSGRKAGTVTATDPTPPPPNATAGLTSRVGALEAQLAGIQTTSDQMFALLKTLTPEDRAL